MIDLQLLGSYKNTAMLMLLSPKCNIANIWMCTEYMAITVWYRGIRIHYQLSVSA